MSVDERALQQSIQLQVNLPGEPLAVECFPALLERQLRLPQVSNDPILTPRFHFELDDFMKVVPVGDRVLLGELRLLFVALTNRRQVETSQVLAQLLLHLG